MPKIAREGFLHERVMAKTELRGEGQESLGDLCGHVELRKKQYSWEDGPAEDIWLGNGMSVGSGSHAATHCCNQLVHPFQHTFFFQKQSLAWQFPQTRGEKLGGQLGFGEITDTLSSIQELTDLMLMFLLAHTSLHLHSLW